MSWADAFAAGAANLFSWPGFLIPVAGTLLAMVASFLPGVGNTSVVVLVMVATVGWDVESVLLMFGALTGGATFMGSITAILFNIPGNVSSTATLLDGYPMARNGLPRTAIACAATASAVGSVFGVLVLLAVLPVVRPLLLEFGPLERLLIGVWGLVTIISVPTSSRLKAAAMTALGLLAAAVGSDPATGSSRWTFGVPELSQGFNVIAMMLGMFTFSELIEWMRSYRLEAGPQAAKQEDSTRRGIRSVFQHLPLTMRASSIGTLVGMIPGVGGTVAGFVAYGHAVQSTPDRSGFGKGEVRGLIAPEAAIDAKDGGALLPAVAFGLPGSEAGVALLAVFAIHGVLPGPPMLGAQLPLTFTLIFALLFSNLLTSVVGVALTPWLARLRNLRIDRIALPGLIVGLVAVVQINGQLFDLYTAVGFGIAGYYWRTHGWPRAPFVIAFVLGSLIETNLALTVQLVELERVDPLERLPSLVLILFIVGSLAWMWVHRTAVTKPDTEQKADLPLALTASVASGLLFALALWGGDAHSAYAICLAATALIASLAVAGRALWQQGPGVRSRVVPALVQGLVPQAGHRIAVVLMLALPFLVWALGLVGGLGLSVAMWHLARSGVSPRSGLRALALAAAYMLATQFFVDRVADLIVPPGALWQLLG